MSRLSYWSAPFRWRLWRRFRPLGAALGVCAAVSAAAAAPADIGIIVTNAAYQDGSIAKVAYAEKDGAALEAAMRQVFKAGTVRKYENLTKTRLNLLFGEEQAPEGSLWKLVLNAHNPKARLFVYYSGHGAP